MNRRFRNGERVLVRSVVVGGEDVALDTPSPGTVARCRVGDDGAWVALDARLAEGVHPFPADDSRGTHVLTFPDVCEAVAS